MKPTALAIVLTISAFSPPAALAQGDAAPMVRLLKSGRLPPERVASVANLICQRGNAEDLGFIFQLVVKPDGFSDDLRRQALDGLVVAAQTRKIIPTVEAGALLSLLDDRDPAIARVAVRLAAAWKAPALAPPLSRRVLDPNSSDDSRHLALDALLAIGGDVARETGDKLLAADNPRLRAYGVTACASRDLPKAAAKAAELLAAPAANAANIDLLFDTFLARQGGADQLAVALTDASVPVDTAKLALRHMYLAGRSDAQLVEVLSKAAGIDLERAPPTPDELVKLSAEVLAKGDPQRGEAVFRRGDLGCLKCHSISGAGGDVGPDLSPVGATSPVDYVITSILHPDLSIKESFLTRNFITTDGLVYQGIVADRDDNRVIIKDATGKRVTIPIADIDEESEGRSLMPKGLSSFLTHAEFLDLVRFIGELGKPGPYAVRSQPTIQRWRYLKGTPSELAEQIPDEKTFAALVLGADPNEWQPAYGCVGGALPLTDLVTDGRKVLYLYGEVAVSQAGEVEVKLGNTQGATVWVDERQLALNKPAVVALDRGVHKIVLRIDMAQHPTNDVRVVVDKPPSSTAEYNAVGGP
jgi:putative heme-binding domain-containing protein